MAGETCALLLAFAGRKTSDSEAVRQQAENGRGFAAAGRLANQDKQQPSARTIQRRSAGGEAEWGRGGPDQHSSPTERPNRSALPAQKRQCQVPFAVDTTRQEGAAL